MYARVVRGMVKPGQMDDFLRLFSEELVPNVKGQAGFQELIMTVDRGDNTALTMIIFSSREAAEADEVAFRQRAAKAAPYLLAPPETSIREVAIRV